MKFNYTIKTLLIETERLYGAGEEFPQDMFEKTVAYKRILELRAAIRLLENYDFKLKE